MRFDNQRHRRQTYSAGKRAEWLALIYLLLKGYRPLARRFNCPMGEIDLIMSRGKFIIFVEVKYRANRDTAAHSITLKQQNRILRAAQYWVIKNPREGQKDMRFDAVLLSPQRWPMHIKNAFVDNTT